MTTYFCEQCDEIVFEEDLVRTVEPHGEITVDCPCASSQLADVQTCDECGEVHSVDHIVDGTDFCLDCYARLEAAGEFE